MEHRSIGIYYFSGTGNTQVIAGILAQAFEEKGSTVEIAKIEDVLKGKIPLKIEEYDILGMGYPVHAFNAPKIFFNFINKLPVGNKKVFLFKTSGDPFMEGGATTMVRNRISAKGYKVVNENLLVMPTNVLTQYDRRLIKQLYLAAEKKVAPMVDNILSERVNLQRNDVVSRVVTRLFSGLEQMGAPFFGKDLKVTQRCNLCEVCIEDCPTQNISRKGERITFGWKCIFCLRCVYNCPQKAITPQLFRFFVLKDYNIQEIIDNPDIGGNFVSKDTKGYYRRFYDYLEDGC